MPLDPFSLEAIRPLIVNDRIEGRLVVVAFKCPESGEVAAARSFLRTTFTDNVTDQVQRHAAVAMHGHLANLVGGLIGHGSVGRFAGGQVARTAMRSMPGHGEKMFDDDDVDRAIVEAFRQVADRFVWDAAGQRWVSASWTPAPAPPPPAGEAPRAPATPATPVAMHSAPASRAAPAAPTASADPFEQLLAGVTLGDAETQLLARMLAEMAHADGRVDDDEKLLLAAYADAGLPDLLEVASADAVDAKALAAVPPQAREAMMAMAMAVAYADGQLRGDEAGRLEVYREGFGIEAARQAELGDLARDHLLRRLYARVWVGGRMDHMARKQARRVGIRLGMPADRLDTLDREARANAR